MTGIYIHIPFCKSRCIYCGFYSTTGMELRQRYVDAVCREMEMRSDALDSSTEIVTIYLGGGTPSQLTIEQLRQLFDAISRVYIYNKVYEITIECNPDDVTEAFVEGLRKLPVNRISMGVQTFNDERLRFLRRRHTAQQAVQAVERLRHAGYKNISIDLMYGFPEETLEDWDADITRALALDIEHISSYCLMYEEGTPLYEKMRNEENERMRNGDEELERQMYYTLIDRLEGAGYEHYEISNFARPGYRSRHNSSYWTGVPYIGLGAAAHSFDGKNCRSWNVADIRQYMEGIEHGERIYGCEELDTDTQYNDTVTVALRTKEGLDLTKLSEKHRTYSMKAVQRYINDGLLELTENRLRLTRKGLFVSDMVMSALMIV